MPNLLASLLAVAEEASEDVANVLANLAGDLLDPDVLDGVPAPVPLSATDITKASVDAAVKNIHYVRDPDVLDRVSRRDTRVSVKHAVFKNPATTLQTRMAVLRWAFKEDRINTFNAMAVNQTLRSLPFEEVADLVRDIHSSTGYTHYLLTGALVATASNDEHVELLCSDMQFVATRTEVVAAALTGKFPLPLVVRVLGVETVVSTFQNIREVVPCDVQMFEQFVSLGLEKAALILVQRGQLTPDEALFAHIIGRATVPGPVWVDYLMTVGQQQNQIPVLADDLLPEVVNAPSVIHAWRALSWQDRVDVLAFLRAGSFKRAEYSMILQNAMSGFRDELGADAADKIADFGAYVAQNARLDNWSKLLSGSTPMLRKAFIECDQSTFSQRVLAACVALSLQDEDAVEVTAKLLTEHDGEFFLSAVTATELLQAVPLPASVAVAMTEQSNAVRDNWLAGEFPLNLPDADTFAAVWKADSVGSFLERKSRAWSPEFTETIVDAVCETESLSEGAFGHLLQRPEITDEHLGRVAAVHGFNLAAAWHRYHSFRPLTEQWRDRLLDLGTSGFLGASLVCKLAEKTGTMTEREWQLVSDHLESLASNNALPNVVMRIRPFSQDDMCRLVVASPDRLGGLLRNRSTDNQEEIDALLERLHVEHPEIYINNESLLVRYSAVFITKPWGRSLLLKSSELVSSTRSGGPGAFGWKESVRTVWLLLHEEVGGDARLWEQVAHLLRSWPSDLNSLLLTARATRR